VTQTKDNKGKMNASQYHRRPLASSTLRSFQANQRVLDLSALLVLIVVIIVVLLLSGSRRAVGMAPVK
jgi:hypothetical protein